VKMRGKIEEGGSGHPLFLVLWATGDDTCNLVLVFDHLFLIVFLPVACFLRWCLEECSSRFSCCTFCQVMNAVFVGPILFLGLWHVMYLIS